MKTHNQIGTAAALVGIALMFAACATVVKGSSQDVPISSDPAGAKVFVDSVPVGTTPTTVNLACGRTHTVRIEKEGYLPHEELVAQSTSGWIAGNILAGGLIGVCVDAATGAMFNLEPEQISANLVKSAPQPAAAVTPSETAAIVPQAAVPAPPAAAQTAAPKNSNSEAGIDQSQLHSTVEQ